MLTGFQISACTDCSNFISHFFKTGHVKFPSLIGAGCIDRNDNCFISIHIICCQCFSFLVRSNDGIARTDVSGELPICIVFLAQYDLLIVMICCCQSPVTIGTLGFPCFFQICHSQIVVCASFIYPLLTIFATVCMHINGIPEDPCRSLQSVDICHHTLCQTKCSGHFAGIASCSVSAVYLRHPQILSSILCCFF